MKFLTNKTTSIQPYTTPLIENYIYNTKEELNQQLPHLFKLKNKNITKQQKDILDKLQKSRHLTIKPADKNLGIVLLNTEDYLEQCLTHLSSTTYQLVNTFPNSLQHILENTVINFQKELTLHRQLYKFLLPPKEHRIPQFYGLPKIHKTPSSKGIPPLRPIISHTNSLLSYSAKFIDHVLQPIARSYTDYLHNSTQLLQILANLHTTDDILLVSMDIVSLYTSIPQDECLSTVYKEMLTHQNLLIFDPNLIIQLLQINMFNNYFEFGSFIFLQTTGIAMGSSFSPTIANIFMSVLFRSFLSSATEKPLLLVRYIDDIFLIWPKHQSLDTFTTKLNAFHPNIKFTITISETSIDFLDITIYKSNLYPSHQLLDTKTFQKSNNLYQYLHFSSNHPKSTFKSIIIGECIRYIRSNTEEQNYNLQLQLFKQRLMKREYPPKFIDKYMKRVKYQNRNNFLQPSNNIKPNPLPQPIYKCLPPPKFKCLKEIVLRRYKSISKFIKQPIFATLKYRTTANILVKSTFQPTDENIVDIYLSCHQTTSSPTTPATQLPKISTNKTNKCHHPRCATCNHLNTSNYFTSTTTRKSYRIRHPFTCNSKNIIYLITCSKCKKQYIGNTRNSLRERINHHRSSIFTKDQRYVSTHFNFNDHNINNLTVQIIDTTTPNNLRNLESFWINTLKTKIPNGLNFINN